MSKKIAGNKDLTSQVKFPNVNIYLRMQIVHFLEEEYFIYLIKAKK